MGFAEAVLAGAVAVAAVVPVPAAGVDAWVARQGTKCVNKGPILVPESHSTPKPTGHIHECPHVNANHNSRIRLLVCKDNPSKPTFSVNGSGSDTTAATAAVAATRGGAASAATGGGAALTATGGGAALTATGGGAALTAIGGGAAIAATGRGAALTSTGGGVTSAIGASAAAAAAAASNEASCIVGPAKPFYIAEDKTK